MGTQDRDSGGPDENRGLRMVMRLCDIREILERVTWAACELDVKVKERGE